MLLKDNFQKTHIRAIVQTNLILPDVDDEKSRTCQRKQGSFSLKLLWFNYQKIILVWQVKD
jgi:hypothetical protein